jgi:hypothetical protein
MAEDKSKTDMHETDKTTPCRNTGKINTEPESLSYSDVVLQEQIQPL